MKSVSSSVGKISRDFDTAQRDFIASTGKSKDTGAEQTPSFSSLAKGFLDGIKDLQVPPKDPVDSDLDELLVKERAVRISQAAPWSEHPDRDRVKEQVLALSSASRNFLVSPPEVCSV